MKREEQEIQMQVFEWAEWMKGRYPELKLMHHIPNGGGRSKAEAGIFKAMGVKRGIPDVFLPAPRGRYHGLYIEFKSRSGTTSKDQSCVLESLQEAGYLTCVCNKSEEAIKLIEKYLALPEVNMTYLLIDKYGEQYCKMCEI